jgi:hypothetical protein
VLAHHRTSWRITIPVGIGADLDRLADGTGDNRVLVVVRQVFDTEAGTAWKPSKRPR